MTDRERRMAENEAAFRDVNESLRYAAEQGTRDVHTMRLVCECGDASCAEFVEVTTREYETVRATPTHFVVRPGHELPDIERVVAANERFSVVEKRPGEPAEVATETDPRDDLPQLAQRGLTPACAGRNAPSGRARRPISSTLEDRAGGHPPRPRRGRRAGRFHARVATARPTAGPAT